MPHTPLPRLEDQNNLVSVGRFLDPSEAQIAKGMLESSGIEVFLEGANANAIAPLAFRVRLSVRREDEATAASSSPTPNSPASPHPGHQSPPVTRPQ